MVSIFWEFGSERTAVPSEKQNYIYQKDPKYESVIVGCVCVFVAPAADPIWETHFHFTFRMKEEEQQQETNEQQQQQKTSPWKGFDRVFSRVSFEQINCSK